MNWGNRGSRVNRGNRHSVIEPVEMTVASTSSATALTTALTINHYTLTTDSTGSLTTKKMRPLQSKSCYK